MTVKITKYNSAILNRNGYTLWLPTNVTLQASSLLTEPDIYAQDAGQQYPLGTKLEYADGRVFRYGKWGATSTNVPIARMVVNANAQPSATSRRER